MGLLDWLTEGLGSGAGLGNDSMNAGMQPPMPPPPLPMGGDPMAAGGITPNGPGLPPPPDPTGGVAPPPIPLPTARPPEAPQLADAGAGVPPPVPPAGAGMPPAPPSLPGAPMSLAPPGGAAENPMLRSLGGPATPEMAARANATRGMIGGIGAALTAAGNSAGKSPGQAFFGGAGAGMEGGQKATDKGYDQRLKSLQLAVAAQAQGDKAGYNKNYADYLSAKLKSDTDKVAGGKSNAWNKPDSQKFIDAQRSVSQDPQVDAANKMLVKMDPSDKAFPAAKAEFDALVAKKQQQTYAVMQLSPQTIAAMNGNPPGTPQNPHVVMNKQDFETYVKPGQAYKNPADGKIYVRKGTGQGKDAEAPAEQAAPSAPVAPGPMPGTATEPADPALEPAE